MAVLVAVAVALDRKVAVKRIAGWWWWWWWSKKVEEMP